jgi:hypothetical protein
VRANTAVDNAVASATRFFIVNFSFGCLFNCVIVTRFAIHSVCTMINLSDAHTSKRFFTLAGVVPINADEQPSLRALC